MDTHVFNESKKRLDPIDNRCMCCGNGYSTGEADNFYIPIYKENDRTNAIVYRNVKYSVINIGVARCPECKRIHEQIKTKAVLTVIALSIFSLGGFPLIGWGIESLSGSMIPFFIFLFLGLIALGFSIALFHFFEQLFANKYSILSRRNAAMEYDLVCAMIDEGWTFDQPTA